MEAKFVDGIRAYHMRLRRRYLVELFVTISVLLAFCIALIVLDLLSDFNMREPLFVPLLASATSISLLLFILIYFPIRFKRLQKALNLEFFQRAKTVKLELIPNPLGGTKFDYYTLFNEAGMNVKSGAIKGVAPYEFNKRLFHVVYVYDDEKYSAIIHLPSIDSPYYIQIHNGNFAPPEAYADNLILKISYVSPYKLQYYASSSATNAKIYLRKENETRFVKFIKIYQATYQYVTTFTDEYLKVEGLTSPGRLRLGEKYDNKHYHELLTRLRLLQALMSAMLERGK
ncbi:MAG TPA: hypothetical protein PLV28_00450 [Bacilli bacterium]|jgi:hypothetical protein|nr:MAG: hypothetical protein EWM49_02770 [Bacillota bacterium]HQB96368.1 hypothetical protein [Bacilli bacterium]